MTLTPLTLLSLPLTVGEREFAEVGPHGTPAALPGQVGGGEDPWALRKLVADPALPCSHQHRQRGGVVPAGRQGTRSLAHDGGVSLSVL